MGTTLNKEYFTKLIEENIAELEKYMPEHSLEKKHTIDVLRESIRMHYPSSALQGEKEERLYTKEEVLSMITGFSEYLTGDDQSRFETAANNWILTYNTKDK